MKTAEEMRRRANKSIGPDSEKLKEIFDYISKQIENSADSGNYYTNVDLNNYHLPSFYIYHIRTALENLGYNVDFFYGDEIHNAIIKWSL